MSAARSHDTYLAAKSRRIASRRGPIKAIVAVERAILIAIWNMETNGVFHDDLGGDYYTKLNRRQDQATSPEPTTTAGLPGHSQPATSNWVRGIIASGGDSHVGRCWAVPTGPRQSGPIPIT
jgi:hypothetical protein